MVKNSKKTRGGSFFRAQVWAIVAVTLFPCRLFSFVFRIQALRHEVIKMTIFMSQRKLKLTLHAAIHQTDIVMSIKNFCSIEVSKDTLLLSTRHLRRSLLEDNW